MLYVYVQKNIYINHLPGIYFFLLQVAIMCVLEYMDYEDTNVRKRKHGL